MASNKRPPLEMDELTNSLKQSSGKGVDAFFPSQPVTNEVAKLEEAKQLYSPALKNNSDNTTDTMIPRYHDTATPLHHDTTISQDDDELIELIRRAVRQLGKEPATQRLTIEEKRELQAIEYTYGGQGIRTSANEIIRIAINYVCQDYKANGDNSVLAKVLKRLNS